MYIIKKLVVSYKKPFWLENQCKFIKGVYNLQTFFAFYISLEISSIFLYENDAYYFLFNFAVFL